MKTFFVAAIFFAFISSLFGQLNSIQEKSPESYVKHGTSEYVNQATSIYPQGLTDQPLKVRTFSDYNYTLDSMIQYNPIFEGTPQPSIKYEYLYDFKRQLVTYIKYHRSGETWSDSNMGECSYPEGENLTRIMLYHMDDVSDEWELGGKEEYSYDNMDNLTLYEKYDWEDDSSWRLERRIKYTYDASSKLVEYLKQTYPYDTILELQERIEYEYNNDNKLAIETNYKINDDTQEMEKNRKREYHYDNGNLTSILITRWDTETNDWVNSWRGEFTYNQLGKALTEEFVRWISSEEIWVPQWRYEYEYDDNSNLISRVDYKWLNESEEWTLNYKYDYVYDLGYEYTDLVFPFSDMLPHDYPDDIVNMPIEDVYFYRDENEWIASYSNRYFYSEVNLGIFHKPAIDINIYPNPASGYLNVESDEQLQKISIVNILGQGSLEKDLEDTKAKLDISKLSPGIYFLRIKAQDTETTKKILIQ